MQKNTHLTMKYVINKITDKYHCFRKHASVHISCLFAWNVNFALDFEFVQKQEF